MTFVIPSDLAPEVYPLAWVVGTWEGHGVVDYPGIDAADFRQRIVFDHDGGPYLSYTSTITLMGPDGEEGQVWSTESGFWRVAPNAPEGVQLEDFQHPLEVVLADASGLLTAYFGAVGNGRIDLATRFAAATESGPDVRGATRMYGNVSGELMWAWDLAAFGQELQSYASARLSRVDGPGVPEGAETVAPDAES
ncbi:FABP family protein [Demequina mangrovi]|uniref:Ferric nitrobindin-like protein n=1 Tax=Demequina mangrovi TaxID=1043493 RepID=A0A1H6VYT3_9MICO|nr:FABP family protein [Demequina mangrovi]SEJ09783.1 protein of unknown function [Demequina mangrovi]